MLESAHVPVISPPSHRSAARPPTIDRDVRRVGGGRGFRLGLGRCVRAKVRVGWSVRAAERARKRQSNAAMISSVRRTCWRYEGKFQRQEGQGQCRGDEADQCRRQHARSDRAPPRDHDGRVPGQSQPGELLIVPSPWCFYLSLSDHAQVDLLSALYQRYHRSENPRACSPRTGKYERDRSRLGIPFGVRRREFLLVCHEEVFPVSGYSSTQLLYSRPNSIAARSGKPGEAQGSKLRHASARGAAADCRAASLR